MLTLVQTYVFHEGRAFYVSTINRESSAALAYGHEYAETLVWEWDAESRTRGNIVGQGECRAGSIRVHQELVQRLFDTGSPNP